MGLVHISNDFCCCFTSRNTDFFYSSSNTACHFKPLGLIYIVPSVWNTYPLLPLEEFFWGIVCLWNFSWPLSFQAELIILYSVLLLCIMCTCSDASCAPFQIFLALLFQPMTAVTISVKMLSIFMQEQFDSALPLQFYLSLIPPTSSSIPHGFFTWWWGSMGHLWDFAQYSCMCNSGVMGS